MSRGEWLTPDGIRGGGSCPRQAEIFPLNELKTRRFSDFGPDDVEGPEEVQA